VAKATVTTMAGMVGALSGVFASALLARMAAREVQRFNEQLELDI
jgi:biopolymer transport protein ExbB